MDWMLPFSLGFIGSFHCAGMCGPIALTIPFKNNNLTTRTTGSLLYNSGRIMTYGFLGLLFGLLGRGIHLAGFQRWISIILGAIMIISVLFPFFLHRRNRILHFFAGLTGRLTKNLKELFLNRSYFSLFSIGILNGLLPCGLVYVAVAGALTSGKVDEGILFMIFFGTGTVTMLLVISLAGNVVSLTFRKRVSKIIPYFIVLLGILFILRGLSLGIPYISPKAEKLVPKEMVEKGNCCK